MRENFVIGIAGGTGSGKTTLARNIHEAFPQDSLLISMDNYYRDHPELSYEERAAINYDHPDSFETDMFLDDIMTLKKGGTAVIPQYDFTQHRRSPETITLESRRIIILEGILLFADPRIADTMDLRVFVDTPADIRIVRRIVRDVKKRARSLDSVVSQYMNTVRPMHEMFVEPAKKTADIIIPEGGKNPRALDTIIDSLRYMLTKEG